jgi:hypothetical protein
MTNGKAEELALSAAPVEIDMKATSVDVSVVVSFPVVRSRRNVLDVEVVTLVDVIVAVVVVLVDVVRLLVVLVVLVGTGTT